MDIFIKKLLGHLPEIEALPLHEIDSLFGQAIGIARRVPALVLTGHQRCHLSGYLFEEGPDLVDLVCHGLEIAPAEFPDIPAGEAVLLRAGNARAQSWMGLSCALDLLARWTRNHADLERATVVKRALEILGYLRQDRKRLFGPRPSPRRSGAMAAAQLLRRLWAQSRHD